MRRMASMDPKAGEDRGEAPGRDDASIQRYRPAPRRERVPTALSSMAVGVIATALAVVGVALLVVAFGYELDLLARVAVAGLGTWALASAIVLVLSASEELGGPHPPGLPSSA